MKNNTSHILRGITLATLIVALAGCASTPKTARHEVVVGGSPSGNYPRDDSPNSAYSYAHGLWFQGEYSQAAIWFEKASNVQTETGEWEFENLLNASVAWLEAGHLERSRQTLRNALALKVQGAPSDRAQYLEALLLGENVNALSPRLRAMLPRP